MSAPAPSVPLTPSASAALTSLVSSTPAPSDWSVDSWRTRPISQQPEYSNPTYKDRASVDTALETLRRLPPLVHHAEVDELRHQLSEVAAGHRFFLQGGDCAERFQDCSQKPIEQKFKILLQMSLILTWGARLPVVRIGRVAGQYGKPRSSPIEKLPNGTVVPSFKGDNINGYDATPESREHNPQRLIHGHFHSAATLNYIRALIKGGYADLHQSQSWDMSGVVNRDKRTRYQEISKQIVDGLDFMEITGIQSRSQSQVKEVDFFTSHEGLVLDYESAVTKLVPNHLQKANYYNLGAHFLWIGNRTRHLDCAHIEYFRGIRNPIGIKVDSEMTGVELITLLDRLDPAREPGRITLITRFGAEKIWTDLPKLIQAVQNAGRQYTTVWACDPMHGNTYTSSNGLKTRSFDAILAELKSTFEVHEQYGSHLGGVHFELTGENVTECVGGPQELGEHHLPLNYTSYCDPRLNWLQGMEMSFLLADLLRLRKTQAFLPHLFSPYGYSAAHTPFHSPPSQSLDDHDQTSQAISQQIAQLTLQNNSGSSGGVDESKEEKKQ